MLTGNEVGLASLDSSPAEAAKASLALLANFFSNQSMVFCTKTIKFRLDLQAM